MDDLAFMSAALDLARQAAARDEVPVGALVVHHPAGLPPRILGTGHNLRENHPDPTAHAEILAIREAATALDQWRLLDCTLYVTLEPCPMCAGAILNARIPRLVYAARDPKAGAVHTLYQLCSDTRLNHRVEIVAGLCEQEAADLLRTFFAARRRRTANP